MRKVRITMETGVPRLDFTEMFNKVRKYVPMDPAVKQAAVEKLEASIRNGAWEAGRLNPLIGADPVTVEPEWDLERNLIA